MVPGSLFKQHSLSQVPTIIDKQKETEVAQILAAKTVILPKDAGLVRQADGSYELTPQVTGTSASVSSIKQALDSVDPIIKKKAEASTTPKMPTITDKALNAALEQYNQARKSPLNLSYNAKTYAITPQQITSWTAINVDQNTGSASLAFDQAAIRNWLNSTVPLVIQKPGVSTVTIVNGTVQSRSNASAGSGLDVDTTISNIMTALQAAKVSTDASVKSLAPSEQYVRQYTPTNEGLAAIISDWQKDHPKLKASVALREISGSGRQASYNGTTQFTMASIYKLYTNWYVFSQSEKGVLSLDSPSGVSGKSILQCIEASIVVSDNTCGKWLLDSSGRSNVNNTARIAGYGSTDLNSLASTANDTVNLLYNLANGGLMGPTNTQAMLGFMQRQIYRSGIPAGSPGATVQDKVGFLGNAWNDAAIVRGSKSTYVLVIYTNGSNSDAIKDLANHIYNLMQT
jgi:beta-lactamase class A